VADIAPTVDTATVPGTTGIKVVIKYPVGSITGFLKSWMPTNAVGNAVMRWK
jgi:hypothetical protein